MSLEVRIPPTFLQKTRIREPRPLTMMPSSPNFPHQEVPFSTPLISAETVTMEDLQ